MRRIGVRELRQQASVWLQRVQLGDSFEVTDRGRPVALLVPIPSGGELERLIASSRLALAEGDLLQLPPPLAARRGRPLPSLLLDQARAAER